MNSLSYDIMDKDENSFNEELKNESCQSDATDLMEYSDYYSNSGFWNKIKKHYKKAGRKLLSIAITLFFALRDDNTPKWARNIIIGALGYFILPLDILPDFVPIAGFADDLATIAVALGAVALYIKEEHKEQANNIISKIF